MYSDVRVIMKAVFRNIWILLAVVVVGWGSWLTSLGGSEATMLPYVLLMVLGAPSAIGVFYFAGDVGLWIASIGHLPEAPVWSNYIVFLLMLAVGYLQWFVFLPIVFNRMKNKRSPAIWGLVLIGLMAMSYGVYRFYIQIFPGFP